MAHKASKGKKKIKFYKKSILLLNTFLLDMYWNSESANKISTYQNYPFIDWNIMVNTALIAKLKTKL